jgi:hypothetical protein
VLQTTTVEIDGESYTIGQVPADKGWSIALAVMDQRGRVLGSLGVDLATLTIDPGAQAAALGRTQQALAQSLRDTAYWREVVQPLLSVCMRGGRPVLSDGWQIHYAGAGLSTLLRVIQVATEHNCAGFFAAFGDTHELVGALERLTKAQQQIEAAPTTED